MPRMRVRKVKRKCNVLGCKCIDTYALTVTSEYGSSVVICKGCLEAALECINEGRIEGLPKAKTSAKPENESEAEQGKVTASGGAEESTTEEGKDKPEAAKPKKNSSARTKKT